MNSTLLNQSSVQLQNYLSGFKPHCAMILGSGWGPVIDVFDVVDTIGYENIPIMGKPGVEGHKGRLVLASVGDIDILIFQGRRHWYEGCGWEPIAFPVFFAKFLGASRILLTNAAGGIADGISVGSVMIIEDHINLMGANPLQGEHDNNLGPRFPDQSSIYSTVLNEILETSAGMTGLKVTRGVYVSTMGPTYETPAEVRMLRNAGASAVGMSTVPEAILANSMDMEIAGISCITNMATGISPGRLTHSDVITASERMISQMGSMLSDFFSRLAKVRND